MSLFIVMLFYVDSDVYEYVEMKITVVQYVIFMRSGFMADILLSMRRGGDCQVGSRYEV